MKRLLCVLTALVLLCGTMIPSVGAAKEIVIYPSQVRHYLAPQTVDLDTSLDDEDLEEYLRNALVNFTAEIDVREFNLLFTQECVDEVAALIYYEIPECYHIEEYSFGGYENDPYIYTISVTYSMTPQEYADIHAVFQ